MEYKEMEEEYQRFKLAYKEDKCYLCGKPFNTKSSKNPCLHSLLRRNKFKKKELKKIYEKYEYHQLSTFLKWCANEETFLKNINNLEEEKSNKKVLSYTIKWKNIEWTFDCSKNDLKGHEGTNTEYPHYHFQMSIDGRSFIRFNDFHVPLSIRDCEILNSDEIFFFQE